MTEMSRHHWPGGREEALSELAVCWSVDGDVAGNLENALVTLTLVSSPWKDKNDQF